MCLKSQGVSQVLKQLLVLHHRTFVSSTSEANMNHGTFFFFLQQYQVLKAVLPSLFHYPCSLIASGLGGGPLQLLISGHPGLRCHFCGRVICWHNWSQPVFYSLVLIPETIFTASGLHQYWLSVLFSHPAGDPALSRNWWLSPPPLSALLTPPVGDYTNQRLFNHLHPHPLCVSRCVYHVFVHLII